MWGGDCVPHMPFTMDIPCTVVGSHCRIVCSGMSLAWLQRKRSLHQLGFDSEGENHDMTLVSTRSAEHSKASMD